MANPGADCLERALLLSWKLAEGVHEGRPFLMRFRDIPVELSHGSQCDQVLVVTYKYPQDDKTGLPSPAQYRAIGDFEERFIDSLERAVLAILVLTRTAGGELEYFVYSRKDAHELLEFLGEKLLSEDPVTFSGGEDPEWKRYKGIRAMISG